MKRSVTEKKRMFYETKKRILCCEKSDWLNSIKSERKVYNKIENLWFFLLLKEFFFFLFSSLQIIKKAFWDEKSFLNGSLNSCKGVAGSFLR